MRSAQKKLLQLVKQNCMRNNKRIYDMGTINTSMLEDFMQSHATQDIIKDAEDLGLELS